MRRGEGLVKLCDICSLQTHFQSSLFFGIKINILWGSVYTTRFSSCSVMRTYCEGACYSCACFSFELIP